MKQELLGKYHKTLADMGESTKALILIELKDDGMVTLTVDGNLQEFSFMAKNLDFFISEQLGGRIIVPGQANKETAAKEDEIESCEQKVGQNE